MYANIDKYLGMYSIPESSLLETETTLKPIRNPADPKVWGPSYWYTLHTCAAFYPLSASPIVAERMKNRILAIPYEIPCSNCRVHAINHIEKHRSSLDKIVSGRHELGAFYVDFHNQVNLRYNKPVWSYEKAYELYSGQKYF